MDESRQRGHWQRRRSYRDPRDPVARAFAEPKVRWLSERLGIGADSSVLDVGAGNGMFTWWWCSSGARVRGVELSQNMIERSPCRHLLVRADAYGLPFEDASFDLVFAGNVLHHLERPVDALREMKRVSRGAVGICEGNRNHPPMAGFGLVSSACRGVLAYSRGRLAELAREAGLEVVAIRAHGYVYENRSPRSSVALAGWLEQRSPGGAYLLMAATSGSS